MPVCCTDPSAMWLDDFEDGQPLATRYVPVIANAAVTAGAGIDGTFGVRNTAALVQFQTTNVPSMEASTSMTTRPNSAP